MESNSGMSRYKTYQLKDAWHFVVSNICVNRLITNWKGVIMSNIQLSGITQDGQEKNFSLADFKGERVLLYFYIPP